MEKSLSAWVVLAIAVCAASVRADVASNDCSAPGQTCMDYFDKHTGVCVEGKCRRSRPGPDGGIVQSEYDCLECVKDDKPTSSGGKGGGGASGHGGKGGSGGDKAAADSNNGDSGCATVTGAGGASNFVLVGAALSLLHLKRRRTRS